MEKAIIGMLGVIVMMIVMAQVVQASTPQLNYCCPICAQLGTPQCFSTYEELEQHFTTEHPAEDITIIWE